VTFPVASCTAGSRSSPARKFHPGHFGWDRRFDIDRKPALRDAVPGFFFAWC